MEVVQLSLTKEQAALLKPFLESLSTSSENPRQQGLLTNSSLPRPLRDTNAGGSDTSNVPNTASKSATGTPGATAYEPTSTASNSHVSEANVDDIDDDLSASSSASYTAKELLSKKAKNAKSTKAQNFLHVSVLVIALTLS